MTLKDMFDEKKEEYYSQYVLSDKKTRYLISLIEGLEDKYMADGAKPKDARTEREDLFREIRLEFKDRLNSKTSPSPEEDDKGNLVDEGTKTAEIEKWVNSYLKDIFGSVIQLDNQKISIDNIFRQVSKDNVRVKRTTKRDSTELQKRKQSSLEENVGAGIKEYLDDNPIINKNIDVIIGYVDDQLADMLDIKNVDLIELEVRGTINMLHGYPDFASESSRNTIYAYWKDIAGKFKPLCDSIDNLIKALPDNKETQSLKSAIAVFKSKGNYVQEMKTVDVSKKTSSPVDATIKIIDAYLENDLGLSPVSNSDTELQGGAYVPKENIREEKTESVENKDSELSIPSFTLTELIPKQMDVLGALYIERYLSGILLDLTPPQINEIKTTVKDAMENHFGWSSEQQVSKLNKHLRRLQKIEPSKGRSFLPTYILNSNIDSGIDYVSLEWVRGSSTGFSSILEDGSILTKPISLAKTNDAIENLFDALLDVFVDQRLMVGGNVSAIRGEKHSKGVTQASYYSSVYGSSRQKIKELKEQKEEVESVLKAIDDYFYRPLFNPKMTLDINFDFKNDIKFKQLKLIGDSDVALAYKELFKALTESRGDLFSRADLNMIRSFLLSVNKPDMQLAEIKDKMQQLLPVIQNLFFSNDKVIETFKEEMASYLGHLYDTLPEDQKKNVRAVIFGRDILKTKKAIKDESEITVFMTLQDFFFDPTVSSIRGDDNKNIIEEIKGLISQFKKSEIEDKILSIHDSVRILKKLDVYYGKGSLSSMEDLSEVIDIAKRIYDVDIIGTEIVKMVEVVDSLQSLAKEVGIPEEVVYFVKANFR